MTKLVVVPEGVRRVRIDRVLAELLPDVSRATVQRWITEGRVTLNGQPCRSKSTVSSGAELSIDPGPPPPTRAEPDASVDFDVMFEDQHLIVVNKPAGLVVHPGRGHSTGTLVNGLLARPGFANPPVDLRDPEGLQRPGIVHRIDKDTSGVLVVAKDERTREGLKEQFSSHSIGRRYVALTDGVPNAGRIETIHRRHPTQRMKFTSKGDTGKRAVTIISVARILSEQIAKLECHLETGRTHQIRIHLAEQCGTPIVLDPLYGRPLHKPRIAGAVGRLGRQALHAEMLEFVHPVTRQVMRFEAEVPPDMANFIRELETL